MSSRAIRNEDGDKEDDVRYWGDINGSPVTENTMDSTCTVVASTIYMPSVYNGTAGIFFVNFQQREVNGTYFKRTITMIHRLFLAACMSQLWHLSLFRHVPRRRNIDLIIVLLRRVEIALKSSTTFVKKRKKRKGLRTVMLKKSIARYLCNMYTEHMGHDAPKEGNH